jgi:hypothetical protein
VFRQTIQPELNFTNSVKAPDTNALQVVSDSASKIKVVVGGSYLIKPDLFEIKFRSYLHIGKFIEEICLKHRVQSNDQLVIMKGDCLVLHL